MPAVGRHREEESARGQQDRLQAQYLMDLVFTNNFELVSSIKCEDWKSLSDHRLVVVEISQPAGKEETKGRERDSRPFFPVGLPPCIRGVGRRDAGGEGAFCQYPGGLWW